MKLSFAVALVACAAVAIAHHPDTDYHLAVSGYSFMLCLVLFSPPPLFPQEAASSKLLLVGTSL